jgi:hypothetical protein
MPASILDCHPYRFALLHPAEQTAEQRAQNQWAVGPMTLGIEVTVPALAARCGLGNIDPQHDGSGDVRTAIEACLDHELPPDGGCLVTIRLDLDALGGMALLALRRAGVPLDCKLRLRVAEIARADAFANGPWPGPRPLPRTAAECAAATEGGALGTAAALAGDHAVPITQRVAWIADWLTTGATPEAYRDAAARRGTDLAAALASRALRIGPIAGGRVAIVLGSAEGAVRLGYLLAPVVVALNPAFRFRGGAPHRKFTVCQWRAGYADLTALARQLSAREPGWGGSPTIIGSPQGVRSKLYMIEVVTAVLAHLPD